MGRREGTAGIYNIKRQKFVDAYAGNGEQAALVAGYSTLSAARVAWRLLKEPDIIRAIEEREKKSAAPLIRSRVRRQEWLLKVLEDPAVEMRDRLKAMEMLKRSCGDFLDRVEVAHMGSVAVLPIGLPPDVLRFIARGGLRETPMAPPALPESTDDDVEPSATH